MLAPLVLFGLIGTPPEAKTYRSDDLGLVFDYPADWKLKKDKYSDNLEFPMADGSTATVQIFKTDFRQPEKVWQDLQRDVATQMNRNVTRQWDETILGVPMLMTSISYDEGGVQKRTLVGLLYTATKKKLNFRLSSNGGVADEAESKWRKALLTLRTTSGEMPVKEDPSKPLVDPTKTPEGRPIVVLRPENETSKAVRTKNSEVISVLGQNVRLYMPDGWKVEGKDGKFTLTNDKVAGQTTLEIAPGGRTEAATALHAASAESFDEFSIVDLRDETAMTRQKSGLYVGATLRVGTDAKKAPLVTWDIVGTNETLLFMIDYSVGSEHDFKQSRKNVEALIDLFALEIVK